VQALIPLLEALILVPVTLLPISSTRWPPGRARSPPRSRSARSLRRPRW